MGDQVDDKLIEIPQSEWATLRDMYLSDWPTHMVGFYTVDNYVRWNKIKSDIKHLHVYSLNGDWQRDGTFVVVVSVERVFPIRIHIPINFVATSFCYNITG